MGLERKQFLLVVALLILGAGILYINSMHYDNVRERFSVTSAEEDLTIGRDDPLELFFTLDNAENIDRLQVVMRFDHVRESTVITPEMNGITYESVRGLQNGSSETVVVNERINEVNRLVLSGEFSYRGDVSLQSITVLGVAQFERVLYVLLNIVGVALVIGPVLIFKYLQHRKKKAIEEQFPNLLRDIVEGTKSGMSLPQSIKTASSNSYGELTPYVRDMGARLDWGIPFERVMRSFARQTGSRTIRRSVGTIIQSYRAGGDVPGVLESVGDNLREIRNLESERESQVYSEVVTGYVIFFIFLGIMVLLVNYLIPQLTFSGNVGPLGGAGIESGELLDKYTPLFRYLVALQAIFSGVVIGKLSEGDIRASAKHIAILFGVGFAVALLFM